jgi:hypothetical protein
MKQVSYWGPTLMQWPVTLTVIWRFLLGACELTHIFACKERKCSNYAENIRRHRKKFKPPGRQRARNLCIRDIRCISFYLKGTHFYQVDCINNRHFAWIRFHSSDAASCLNTAVKPQIRCCYMAYPVSCLRFLARELPSSVTDCKFVTRMQRNFKAYD